MKANCPNCSKQFTIPDKHLALGKRMRFRCPGCQKVLVAAAKPAVADTGQPSDQQALARSMAARTLKGDALTAAILEELEELPPMPQAVLEARQVAADPEKGLDELARVIETDQSLVSKILKIANSAYYGMSGKVSSIQRAVVMLGQEQLVQAVTLAGTQGLMGRKLPGYGLDSGNLWMHVMAVAFGARRVARQCLPDLREDATIAGLLHDAGKIILDPHVHDRREMFFKWMAVTNGTMLQAEKAMFGFNHADIAAVVCQAWKIPEPISLGIRYHHAPSKSDGSHLAHILHAADYIAILSGIGLGEEDHLYEMEAGTMDFLGLRQDSVSDILFEVMQDVDKLQKGPG
jgi:predicted Zn finger-like uncharacterized protein